jgi:hypothetical protein
MSEDVDPGARLDCPDSECEQPWQYVWEPDRAVCYWRPMSLIEQIEAEAIRTHVLDATEWPLVAGKG